jgi:hypothetical protein
MPAQIEVSLGGRNKPRVTVQNAADAYMTDARSRGLQTDTVKKLERIFEKQFLPWTRTEGLEFLDEVDLDALISFRSTWTEGAVVKAKKQDRIIGFFWESFRRNFINQNPALSLSKISEITGQSPISRPPNCRYEVYFLSVEVFFRRRGSASGDDLGGSEPEVEPL